LASLVENPHFETLRIDESLNQYNGLHGSNSLPESDDSGLEEWEQKTADVVNARGSAARPASVSRHRVFSPNAILGQISRTPSTSRPSMFLSVMWDLIVLDRREDNGAGARGR
jgi:hypothetical protein